MLASIKASEQRPSHWCNMKKSGGGRKGKCSVIVGGVERGEEERSCLVWLSVWPFREGELILEYNRLYDMENDCAVIWVTLETISSTQACCSCQVIKHPVCIYWKIPFFALTDHSPRTHVSTVQQQQKRFLLFFLSAWRNTDFPFLWMKPWTTGFVLISFINSILSYKSVLFISKFLT